MTAQASNLSFGDKQVPMPVKEGTIGPSVVDISKLYGQTGMFTYDPGFTSTAACESKITYIDGDKGVLLYRGYPIEQLAEHSDFLETAYLILFGELPTESQLAQWTQEVTNHTMLHENLKKFLEGFRYDAHPMGMFLSAVGALSTFYLDAKDIFNAESRRLQMIRLVAKVPGIAA